MRYLIALLLLCQTAFAQTEVRRAPLAVSNDDGTDLSYPWKVTFTSGVTDNSNGTASISVVNVHAHGEYTTAHATATAAASGFMPALSGLATDYLNGTGAWSIPSGTSLDHQHPNYTPLSDYSTHAHSQYSTTGQLGGVANQLGTHQHNISYPSASQFQQLYSIATTNQHDTYYADIEHQHTEYQVAGSFADSSHTHSNYTARIDNIHPEYTPLSLYSVHAHSNYQVAGSFADATHNHSNYTPLSDFTTHQHNASYPGVSQFQQLYSIATTNQHDTYYSDIDHQHSGYQATGSFADSSHIHPNYTARIDNIHPEYTPLSLYSVHTHPNYTARIDNTHPEYTPLSDYSTHIHSNYTARIDNIHPEYTPLSAYSTHTHSNYTARIDNIHPEYTPLSAYSVHTHPNYQTAGSFADATHNHSNYTPLSDFTTHQHNTNYATVAQNQAVAAIATTNTHAVATPASFGFVLALPNDATRYWDGSGAYSVPAGGGTTGHLHPFYTPLSDYGTHVHSNYVPYTGATSTVNLGSQHLTAGAMEVDGLITGGGANGIKIDNSGNVGVGTTTPGTLLGVQKDQTAATQIRVRNDTSDAAAQSSLSASYGNFSQYITMAQYNPTFTTSGLRVANSSGIFSAGDGNINGLRIYTLNSANLTLGTVDTAALTVDTSQRVGIGTVNPSMTLDVSGNVNATNLYGKYDNTHATVNTTHVGFTPILPNVATQFLSGTGAWSVPTADASPHTHTTYVPYTGANSTVNLGAQHLVADTVEFDGTAYITGNTGIGKTPQTLLDVNNRFLVNSTSKTLTDAATQLFEVALLAGEMTGGTIIWTIEAGDAMDWQSLSGITTYAAVNNAGSYYTTVNNNTANDSKALSSGTLTTVWDILTGTNKVIIRVTPTGSLTETIYRITYTISNNNSQAITIL